MNFKVENLELMNDRFTCHLPRPCDVFDSRRSRPDKYTSLSVDNRMGQIPFLTTTERFLEKDEITTSSSESNSILINSKGDFIYMDTILNRPNRLMQFSSDVNKGRTIEKSKRPQYSFGSNRLGKTLFDDDVEVLTIDKRLKLDEVNSPKWSKAPKFVDEKTNSMTGPGYYEVYDNKEKGPDPIINAIPRFEENPEPIAMSDDARSVSSSLSEIGSIKWNNVSRWNHPLYRKESYVKTSGMKLPQDYDKVLDKRILFDFTKMPKRDLDKPIKKSGPRSMVIPDYGNKITMQTQSKTSPVKYAAAFQSKIPNGMKIIYATSGVNIGPGTLQLPPAITVKDPDKVSYYMLRGRGQIEAPPESKPKSPTDKPKPAPVSRALDYDNREELRVKIMEERTKHGKWTQCAL
jgi:hypothetical protein